MPMQKELRGVRLVGVGKARKGLTDVSNADVANRLGKKAREMRQWWLKEDSPRWWFSDDPMAIKRRTEAEKKFLKQYGHKPVAGNKEDWRRLFPCAVRQSATTAGEITALTGVRCRQLAGDGVLASDLAAEAIRNAAEVAKVSLDDLEALYFARVTPDNLHSPPTASRICKLLGIGRYLPDGRIREFFSLDGEAACSSFPRMTEPVIDSIKVGRRKKVVVAGAEVMHCVNDDGDRNVFPIFGDGAGALVLESCPQEDDAFPTEGFWHGGDSSGSELIVTHMGGARQAVTAEALLNPFHLADKLDMEGRKVFELVRELVLPRRFEQDQHKTALPAAMAKLVGIPRFGFIDDFTAALNEHDLILFHQANDRIIAGLEEWLVEKYRYLMPVLPQHPLAWQYDFGLRRAAAARGLADGHPEAGHESARRGVRWRDDCFDDELLLDDAGLCRHALGSHPHLRGYER